MAISTAPIALEAALHASASSKSPIASTSSAFFMMLPGAVKQRLPKIPFVRRSLSSYALRSSHASRTALAPRPHSADFTPTELFPDHTALGGLLLADSAGEMMASKQMEWKYANQGLNLLESAVSESQYPDSSNKAFARQLYINGLTYLLRGLPRELSPTEYLSLKTALPPQLQPSLPSTATDGPRLDAPRSLLHRYLASGIVQIFLALSVLLPHLKVLLRGAYRYERAHRVSERIFAASIDAVDGLGHFGVNAVDLLLHSGNGRVGELLAACLVWWVEGISGGVKEGVDEGMVMFGMREARGKSAA